MKRGLATKAAASIALSLSSCAKEETSPTTTAPAGNPSTAESLMTRTLSSNTQLQVRNHWLNKLFFSDPYNVWLKLRARSHRATLHGQLWVKHKRLSVLHHNRQNGLAGWETCCVWRSGGGDGCAACNGSKKSSHNLLISLKCRFLIQHKEYTFSDFVYVVPCKVNVCSQKTTLLLRSW